jgi:menaquinone reductase, integral membrane subunit
MKAKKHIRFSPWILWLGVLSLVILAGLAAGLMVFWKGLGITNLTDLVPWGLWITLDLSSIAMSAGAFALCAAVYLLGLKKFQPVARTATFIGLIGYSMAMLSLILDIGRPDRFWHAIVYWNKHSLLWEVTMCVTLYLTVLLLESMPIFARFEWLRIRWPKLTGKMTRLHHYAPFLAIAGLCLSLLHQSSLGALYGVLKARPLWYRPDVSVLFIASALAGGISLTVFASMLSARLTRRANVDDRLLERLAQFIGWVLVVYLYFRFWDALAMTYTYEPGRTEGLRLLTSGPLSFNFWAGEVLLGAVVPILLLFNKKTRLNPTWRMVALALVVGGVVAFRWDTNLSGLMVVLSYLPGDMAITYTAYRPSLVELLSGGAILGFGLLCFSLGVRYLKVVDHHSAEHEPVAAPEIVEPVGAD